MKKTFFCQSLLFTPGRTMLLPTAWYDDKEGRNKVQSSIVPAYKKSKNLHKPQQTIEMKVGTSVIYSLSYSMVDKPNQKMSQVGTRALIVEPQLHFAQPLVSNQMNTGPLHKVDTTIPPPLMTKKEKEETRTHTVDNTKMLQKDEELLKVVQMVDQSLQQQIVLGMHMANMSQQCTDVLIKSHNRRDMDHVLNNIPTLNRLEPEKCVDWATRIREISEKNL